MFVGFSMRLVVGEAVTSGQICNEILNDGCHICDERSRDGRRIFDEARIFFTIV